MEIGIELESSSIDTTNFHIKMRYQSTTILNKKEKKKDYTRIHLYSKQVIVKMLLDFVVTVDLHIEPIASIYFKVNQ